MVNTHQILQEIENLKKHPLEMQDLQVLEEWSRSIQEKECYDNIRNNPLVIRWIKEKENTINYAKMELTTNRKLTDMDRQYLFAKIELCSADIAYLTHSFDEEAERIATEVMQKKQAFNQFYNN